MKLIQDIKPYTGLELIYMKSVEPFFGQLNEMMGKKTKIIVKDGTEPREHYKELRLAPNGRLKCYCADCYGDFSGGSDE